jgi:hypothetical protein
VCTCEMGSAVAFHLYPTFSKCESSVIKIPVINNFQFLNSSLSRQAIVSFILIPRGRAV